MCGCFQPQEIYYHTFDKKASPILIFVKAHKNMEIWFCVLEYL
jgi:hypothetical protein